MCIRPKNDKLCALPPVHEEATNYQHTQQASVHSGAVIHSSSCGSMGDNRTTNVFNGLPADFMLIGLIELTSTSISNEEMHTHAFLADEGNMK
mmetsp:Transcript_11608/g.28547  ORF Transcript_11608/g.28547 Transcript_11608/m.28547 type:complete len:93 (+) Transcript_11608:194-472(+)